MKNDVMCFSKNAKFLFNRNQVVAVNRYNGGWMRISKECYEYLLKGMDAELSKQDFLEAFMDEDDKAYIKKMIEKLESLGVVVDVAKNEVEGLPQLESVQISLTNRCNLKCKHCASSATALDGEDPLNTVDLKRVIDKLISCRVKKLILSGGEPLVREDLIEILRYIREKDKNIEVSIMTNALLFNEKNVKEIIENVNSVDISLDGFDEESCSKIRGKNVFSRVLKNIALLQRDGMDKIAVSMVSLGVDFDADRKFNELCKKLNVTPMIRRLSYTGRAKENEEYLRKLEKRNQSDEVIKIQVEKARKATKACSCKAGIRMININESGDIYPCNTFDGCMHSIGNIMKIDSLYDFLKDRMNSNSNDDMDFFKFNPYYEQICSNCNVRYFCWTCPYGTMDYLNEKKDISDYCESKKAFLNPIIWGEMSKQVGV